MKRIRVHTSCVRHPSVIWQTRLQYEFECLETPAVPQAQAHEVRKAIQNVVVAGDGEDDVFDE